MATKPENTFRAGVHKYLPHDLHHEKMNNPYSSGTADDWYSGNSADLWVEYKFLPKTPQRAIVRPFTLLSPLQMEWLNGRHEEGRTVAVVIGCPDGGIILRNKEWLKEITPETFASNLVPRKEIAAWIVHTTTHTR